MPVLQSRKAESLRLWLFGGFRAAVGDGDIPASAWRLRKARSLVKLLALSPAHRLHRDEVIDLLWPHLDADAAGNNYRKALHVARRTLDPGPAAPRAPFLEAQDDVLTLAPSDRLWVDADAFEAAAAEARRHGEIRAYRTAVALYKGDLLPEDRYEEWCGRRREALAQEYLSLLAGLAALYEAAREYRAAIDMLQQLLAREPSREDAHRSLMRVYALSGQKQDALRQYRTLRDALARDLDVEPDAATRRLHEELIADRFPLPETQGLGVHRPPLDFRATGRTNLPLQLTRFIGRARELAEVHERISDNRQLTLTGPGGVGKTRLALEVATRVLHDFPDGVWIADLSALPDHALIPQAVATVFDIREEAGGPLLALLADSLRSKHTLLILDNCEHLAAGCAELADYLLRHCPDLHLLSTSREVLGLEGELVYRVPPLPGPERPVASPADLAEYDAVRLFADRAALSQPGFAITAETAPFIARICAHLDGIPLAIELAAARLRALPLDAVAARLDDRFRLLTGGTRTALSRHQTMRAAIDWSYDLLPAPEQTLLRRLSVFAGGFTLESAQAVRAEAAHDEMEALDLLARLVEKSLVSLEKQAAGGRYRLLETMREYLRGKLVETGEADGARDAHARFFLSLTEEASVRLRGPEQAEWLDRLEAEHDNLRAAVEWSFALRESIGGLGARLAVALSGYWHARGYLTEGRAWLARTLAAVPAGQAGRRRLGALVAAARLAFAQDDFRPAADLMREAAALAREDADPQALALSLALLGHAVWHEGDRAAARAFCEESREARAGVRDDWSSAAALAEIATVARHDGDAARAAPLLEESLALYRRSGDSAGIAQCLYQLGLLAADAAEYLRASSLMEEALALQRRLGRKPAVATTLGRLGRIAFMQGDYTRATTLLEDGIALERELAKRWDSAYRRCGLAFAALAVADLARARTLFEESLGIQERGADEGQTAECLLGLAVAARHEGDTARASRLLDQSAAAAAKAGRTAVAAAALCQMGLLAHLEGDVARAEGLLRRSAAQRRAIGDTAGLVDCVEALSGAALARRDAASAARLLGAADSLRARLGAPRWPVDRPAYDRLVHELRAALGAERYSSAAAEGGRMTLDEAFAAALETHG